MIKLSKGPEPKVLIDNSTTWTAVLLSKISSGVAPTPSEKTRYRHKDIKAALEKETSKKCAYCESKLKHIHHGDVEHIHPKSLDPSKQFSWSNLTLACELCNQNKSDRDPKLEAILDPYSKDPEHHICFLGAMAYPLGTAEGISSISLLELNRVDLVLMRNETVKRVMGIFETILRPDIPLSAKKALLVDFEMNELGRHAQYSAVVSAIYSSMKSKLPSELQ
jgi:5-methylcytosine-specific restriction endonuclease McrA